jgi:hypothetical protein
LIGRSSVVQNIALPPGWEDGPFPPTNEVSVHVLASEVGLSFEFLSPNQPIPGGNFNFARLYCRTDEGNVITELLKFK